MGQEKATHVPAVAFGVAPRCSHRAAQLSTTRRLRCAPGRRSGAAFWRGRAAKGVGAFEDAYFDMFRYIESKTYPRMRSFLGS